jgi:hypothetical protein
MANQYLRPILDQLFGETFLHSYFYEERMQMSQAAVYLLRVMGFPLPEYSYRWVAGCGPASRALTYDLSWGEAVPMKLVKFRKEYQDCIDRLRKVIEAGDKEPYSIAEWLQCIAALHYLRVYVMKWNAPIEEVISETERRIPHLCNHDANVMASQWLDGLEMDPELFEAWWPTLKK